MRCTDGQQRRSQDGSNKSRAFEMNTVTKVAKTVNEKFKQKVKRFKVSFIE